MRKWRQSVVRGADTHEGYYSVEFRQLWSFKVDIVTNYVIKIALQNQSDPR